MTAAAPATLDMGAPFFPEGAAIRVVNREAALLLGGGRALLMQVANPRVAAGVAAHSRFREGKRARLLRTLRPTLAIVFGTESQAHAAAAAVNRAHHLVVGDGYDARDPALLFWVLATLIDTAIVVHQRFLRPIPSHIAEAYYQDMLRAGALLGVRADEAPRDVEAFQSYMQRQLARLEVTDQARAIAAGLFAGRNPASAAAGWAIRSLTADLLPVSLRDAYGLRPGPASSAGLRLLQASSRALLPRVPLAFRSMPRFLLPQGAPV